MLSEHAKDIARRIGDYYFNIYAKNYKLTEQGINLLRISKIEVDNDTVSITTEHPGLLIGNRGKNIAALSEFLEMKIRIIEDTNQLYSYLIPSKLMD